MFLSFLVLPLLALMLLGWLLPLAFGIVRRRRGRGGVVLLWIGSVWGALSVATLAFVVISIMRISRVGRMETETFAADRYDGPTGNISIPYDGDVSLLVQMSQKDGNPRQLMLRATNQMLLAPAGEMSVVWMQVAMPDTNGHPRWTAWITLEAPYDRINLPPDGHIALTGGPPLTAAIAAKRQSDGKLSLDLKILDSAGHRVTIYDTANARTRTTFEAVSPTGEIFWRGLFEHG
ncbi:MAG: hypothetical protein PHR35_12275 [Kiritimatiellae bacterium]|nr:hypothetical protein [Kiritimatiellia bacterium]